MRIELECRQSSRPAAAPHVPCLRAAIYPKVWSLGVRFGGTRAVLSAVTCPVWRYGLAHKKVDACLHACCLDDRLVLCSNPMTA